MLFDFCFFKFYVLAYNRVIFLQDHFFGLRTRVFLRHVEIARVSGAEELDFD